MLAALAFITAFSAEARSVVIQTPADGSNRVKFAAEQLKTALEKKGFTVTEGKKKPKDGQLVRISEAKDNNGAKEGFTITSKKGVIDVVGNDGTGAVYGSRELIDRLENEGSLDNLPATFTDAPEMVLRGACVGVQKPYLLPGHGVYEYPYTPENFPWFYDKKLWTDYLDMLVANRMNSVYLWNGHPFSSLVKLKDYPFAVEVDDETFKKNEEMFSFLNE